MLSFLTQPNMYARGILFGKMKYKMKYELGDHSFVRCPENGLVADVEFKTKGYFGGTYNAIGGVIRNEKTGETLYELSGMWSGEMVAKNVMVRTKIRCQPGPLLRIADGEEGSVVQRNTRSAYATERTSAGGARRR